MNITNKDYQAIQNLISVVSGHLDELDVLEAEYYIECVQMMQRLEEKRIQDNERRYKLISEKRKSDPNYARSLNENGKQKSYYKKK